MKKMLYIFVVMLLVSCSNWQYKDITYLRCKKLDKTHVHLYYHETCEWNCLNIENEYVLVVDTAKIIYKTNKEGKIKKVKLLK
jgi:hypothetical protein